MFFSNNTHLFKSRLVLPTVIILGSSMLASCAHVENIESAMDPTVSSELPPEAAVQYLNKILSQATNKIQTCRAFTMQGVITHKGATVPYTASNMRAVLIRGQLPGSHNMSLEIGRCEFTRSCRCYIISYQNKDEENLILTALHSLGVTELLVTY